MIENNLIFYLKRWFLNRYTLLTAVVIVSGVFFVYNQKKLVSIIDLTDDAEQVYEKQLKEQQEKLSAMGLEKDPSQLSYVEIMEQEDFNLGDEKTLKQQDTDNDGLSDYEEIYIYGTSAFLEDTDGDGLSDSQEIKAGTDPLCAKGDICGSDEREKDLAQKEMLIDNVYISDEESGLADFNKELSEIDIANMDPNFLRQALIDSGAPVEEIESLSDEEVVTLYQMAMQEAQATEITEGEEATDNDTPIIIDEDNLTDLTVEEIRYLLTEQGVEPEVLAEIGDEELRLLFDEAIQESQK